MFIKDVIKFVQNFAGIIDKSTPHLYMSALPFSPLNSILARSLLEIFAKTAQVAVGQQDDWPRNHQVLQGHTSSVSSVAFSPDGRHILSGSWDEKFDFWMHRQVARLATPCKGTPPQSVQLHSHQMEGTLCQVHGITQSDFGMHRQVTRWAALSRDTPPQSTQLHSH